MTFKQLYFFILCLLMLGCNKNEVVSKIEGKRIEINEDFESNTAIDSFIAPYRNRVNEELDSVLAIAKDTYTKSDGNLNTAIGNFMADVVAKRGNGVYKSRTGNDIDMVMLNHGGIRAILSKGPVTVRDAYKIMPFENSIVVVEMTGKLIQDELIPYLIAAKRAHPIQGLKLHIDENDAILTSLINEEPIDPDKVYHVATNDYLYFGGDRMNFFKKGLSMTPLDYKIRNALIDHLKSIDTVQPVRDDRFIKKGNL